MVKENLFEDGRKIDGSKKHLIVKPAYARIDEKKGEVYIWDHGGNYRSFSEMMNQRKGISPGRMYSGLHSAPGLQFANRGLGVAEVLTYRDNRFLVATCKRGQNTLALINGYYGNGVGGCLEQEDRVPKDINVADSILRTSAIESLEEVNVVNNFDISRECKKILEEFSVVRGKEILKGSVKIVKNADPVSFAPFENAGFRYTSDIGYEVTPMEGKLECLVNLSPFPVMSATQTEGAEPKFLGENVGIYFDSPNNCYQIVTCVQTTIKNIDFIFHAEDKYRDEEGMDTFLYRYGLKLIKLNDKEMMVPEIFEIEGGKLKKIAHKKFLVSEAFIPADKDKGVVTKRTIPFSDAIQNQYRY
ncbi:MAG: hypothetical protein ABIA78_02520 [archaeon]